MVYTLGCYYSWKLCVDSVLVAVIYKTFLFLFQVIAGTEDAVFIGGWISGAYEDRLRVEVQTP